MREIKVTLLQRERERERAKGNSIHMFIRYTTFTASSYQFFKSNITTYVTRFILQVGRVSHMNSRLKLPIKGKKNEIRKTWPKSPSHLRNKKINMTLM
jgi:hypothetical protein